MDALRFDRLARVLASMPTRRAMLGLSTAGLLGALGLDDTDAKKRKGENKKKCKKKCGPCQKCKKGKCKPKAAGTPCGTGKQCFANGACLACDVCADGCPHETLQAAIDAPGSDGATIQLCPGTYPTNASIASKTLTVIGAGAGKGGTTLDGGGAGSVLTVQEATVTLHDLRLTGGDATDGGGIYNSVGGTLTLDACVVSENEAIGGGGIYNLGKTLTLIDSDVTGNEAINGGGILQAGATVTLDAASRVTGNKAGVSGGGIYNSNGTVTLASTATVSGNTPDNCAGADVPLCEE